MKQQMNQQSHLVTTGQTSKVMYRSPHIYSAFRFKSRKLYILLNLLNYQPMEITTHLTRKTSPYTTTTNKQTKSIHTYKKLINKKNSKLIANNITTCLPMTDIWSSCCMMSVWSSRGFSKLSLNTASTNSILDVTYTLVI